MKKFIKPVTFILISLMLLSMCSAVFANNVSSTQWYCDIDENAWYYDSVESALGLGIMKGTLIGNGNNNLFSPNDELTREQFVTILMRTVSGMPGYGVELLHKDWKTIYDYTSRFTDVDKSMWYGSALMWAENTEVTNGVSNNEFGIGKAITREEMATLIYRYTVRLKLIAITEDEIAPEGFKDADEISAWATDAITFMSRTGLIKGDENGYFRPSDTATRAEAAAIFVRLFYSANIELSKIFDTENVGKIVFETRDENENGLYRSFTLEDDSALNDALNYLKNGKIITSGPHDSSVGVNNNFTLYDNDGNDICTFTFTDSCIYIDGYRFFNYEDGYLKMYVDKLFE